MKEMFRSRADFQTLTPLANYQGFDRIQAEPYKMRRYLEYQNLAQTKKEVSSLLRTYEEIDEHLRMAQIHKALYGGFPPNAFKGIQHK